MNDEIGKQILEEIRKQTRFSKIAAIFSLVILVAVGGIYFPWKLRGIPSSRKTSSSTVSWSQVRSLRERQQYEDALAMARKLVEKSPNFYYGYSMIGYIYLELGDSQKAGAYSV